MKSLKVFYMGKPLKEVYAYATRWQVIKWKVGKFMRKLLLSLVGVNVAIWIAIGFFYAGSYYMPKYVLAEKQVVVTVEGELPILERIADCESGIRTKNGRAVKGSASHFDPKTNQVYTKANTNKTVDIGVMMINEYYWGKTAAEMGFDLTKEKDNRAFGRWLFLEKGSEPWSASKTCWQ